ncbi:MAG TPA: iron-containing alcohol dehydrogenase [Thermoplasmata archaeon]|nr:iron-containing alcohol dehydrogenase [Thermoplasmata archaeon]
MSGFFVAPRIAWGTGAIEQLSGLGARRALLLVDRSLASASGPRRIAEELAKSDATIETVTDVGEPETLAGVRILAERIRQQAPDWVVAVGGGRTIDGAKAARLAAERPDADLASFTPMADVTEPPRIRLAAIPSTSGSGAEASWAADLFADDGSPIELAHRALVPDWALIDPALARGLPVDERVDGGFETLALAAEAYVSAWSNPFSDALAGAAAATVVERLPHAVRWSDDPDALEALHFAATLGGLAASNAQRGLAHALARALVRPTGLRYGRLLGIALPYVLDFDQPGARDRLERLADRVRAHDDRTETTLAERARRLADQVRLPLTVREAGGDLERARASLERVVAETRRAPASLGNPRVPTAAEVADLARAILGEGPG